MDDLSPDEAQSLHAAQVRLAKAAAKDPALRRLLTELEAVRQDNAALRAELAELESPPAEADPEGDPPPAKPKKNGR